MDSKNQKHETPLWEALEPLPGLDPSIFAQTEDTGEGARILDIIAPRRVLERVIHLDLTEFAQHNDSQPYTCGGIYDVFRGKIKKTDISESIIVHSGRPEIDISIKRFQAPLMNRNKNLAVALARELKFLSGLKHPNILSLLGFISKDIYFSFVSEWMDQGTAIQYVKRISPDINVIAQLSIGIGRGLGYLHQNHVRLSNLTAANILISPSNEPLICDFGISRRVNAAAYGERFDPDSIDSFGSTRWMAPELFGFNGGMAHSEASDVWSYGMTIIELLTRKEPYNNICFEPVVMFAIMNGQIPSLEDSQLYSGDMQVQKRLYELCKQCWVSDPKKRATIEAILEYMSPTDFSDNGIDNGIDGESDETPSLSVKIDWCMTETKRADPQPGIKKRHRGVNRLLKNERFIQLNFTLPSFKPLAAAGNWQLDAGKILDLDYLQGPATEPPLKEMRISRLTFPVATGHWFFDINPGRIISVFDVLSATYRFMHTPISSQRWDIMRSWGGCPKYVTEAFSRRVRANNIDHESLHGACRVDILHETPLFKGIHYEHDKERDDGNHIPVFTLR